MFFEAMLEDGVVRWEAELKYAAVSAYSWVGGSCAAAVTAVEDLRSIPEPETFYRTDELFAFAARVEVMGLDPAGMRGAATQAKAIAQVSKPLTFDALVEFRLAPTEANLARIERAIESEQTTAEEIRELSALARAVTGTGSTEPPRQ